MRLRLRDRQPAPVDQRRRVAARDTALFRGALLEIQRMDAENARLRRLLAEHRIKDPGPARP